jgi:hypothetical protein
MDSNSTFYHSHLSVHIFTSDFLYTNAEITDVKGKNFTGLHTIPLFHIIFWFGGPTRFFPKLVMLSELR